MTQTFTVRELAHRFDVVTMTVYGWIRSGELEVIRNPATGRIKISDEAVERFLSKRKTKRGERRKGQWIIE